MADIVTEVALIQAASQGSVMRSAIVAALEKINSEVYPWYEGSYRVAPGTSSIVLSTSMMTMAANLVVEAFPLASKIVTENGVYSASNDSVGGYSEVTVSIPYYSGSYALAPSTVSYTLSLSGLMMSSSLLIEAYPEAVLLSKTVTSNGVYYASDDSADGYSQVEVSLPLARKIISVNGIYSAADDGAVGYYEVEVEASGAAALSAKTVTSNGVYSASDDGVDGYSTVTVSLPVYSGPFSASAGSVQQTFPMASKLAEQDFVVEALSYYSGSYVVAPSTVSLTLPLSGLMMSDALVVEAFSEAVLLSKTITSNGVYYASDDSADGYERVEVNIAAVGNTWEGTQSAYDALGSYDSSTTYFILEESGGS